MTNSINLDDLEQELHALLDIQSFSVDDFKLSKNMKEKLRLKLGALEITDSFEKNAKTLLHTAAQHNELERTETNMSLDEIILLKNRRAFKTVKVFDDSFIERSMRSGMIEASNKQKYEALINVACGEMLIAAGLNGTKKWVNSSRHDLTDLVDILKKLEEKLRVFQPHIFGVVTGGVLDKTKLTKSNEYQKLVQHFVNTEKMLFTINQLKTIKEDFSTFELTSKWYGHQLSGPKERIALKVFTQKFFQATEQYCIPSRKLSRSDPDLSWIENVLSEFGIKYKFDTISSVIRSLKRQTPEL